MRGCGFQEKILRRVGHRSSSRPGRAADGGGRRVSLAESRISSRVSLPRF